MRLSQVASSYSFLYRKSGTNASDGVPTPSLVDNSNNNTFNNIRNSQPSSEFHQSTEQGPYFISHDGSCYDKHYRLASPSQTVELRNSELLRSCPQATNYTTYQEYERDLIYWKDQVTTLLENSNVKLPQVMGLYYSRPATTTEETKPKPPAADEESSEKEEIKESADKDPWQSQLIPEEPNPEQYNSYDEYKTALVRWAGVSSRVQGLPPHADSIQSDHLKDRCTIVMQSSLPKGTRLYLKKQDILLKASSTSGSSSSINFYNNEKKGKDMEEAYPLKGASSSQHRIDILPVWHPQRGVFKWVMLFISCLFSVGSYFTYDSIGVVEEDIEEHFNITSSQFGLLYSVYTFPNIILPFFGGIFLDRIGLPVGTTACTFLVVAGAVLVALAPAFNHSFSMMLIGRFIFGVGAETSYVAQNTICCVWFKDGQLLAFAMGLVVSAGRLGAFATFSTNASIVSHFGSYTAALWAGAFFASLSFFAGLLYMILHYYAEWMIKGTRAKLDVPQSQPVMSVKDVFAFPPVFYLLSFICCIYYSAVFPFQSTAVSLMERVQNIDEDTAGWYVSIIPATALFFSPIFGIIVDKFARRIYFVAVGLILMIPAFLLLIYSWWPALASMIIIGFGFSLVPAAIWPCLPLLIEERHIGTSFGMLSGILNAGLTLSYWLQGEMKSNDGKEEAYLFAGMVGMGFIATCIWLIIDSRMGDVCNRVSGAQAEKDIKEIEYYEK